MTADSTDLVALEGRNFDLDEHVWAQQIGYQRGADVARGGLEYDKFAPY